LLTLHLDIEIFPPLPPFSHFLSTLLKLSLNPLQTPKLPGTHEHLLHFTIS